MKKGKVITLLSKIVSVLALTLIAALIPLKVFAGDDSESNGSTYGSITVCKIIIDQAGSVIDGHEKPQTALKISSIDPSLTSEAPAIGQFGQASFTTPLSFSASILGNGNDSQCTKFENLALGSYYYGQESIDPPEGWTTPKYNDQFTVPTSSLSDFFQYDGSLFDGQSANDESRNKNADGHIFLQSQRPDRTLIVLNQIEKLPATGGSEQTQNAGGSQAPTCPVDGKPQTVDQVWFSDITPTSVTVHWANKNDASGFQIAYGPENNKSQWGVQVGNVNHLTITELPQNVQIWVSVAPLNGQCSGDPSSFYKAQGPQVLAATGLSQSLLGFLAGIGLISFGLWQAQKGLGRKISTI